MLTSMAQRVAKGIAKAKNNRQPMWLRSSDVRIAQGNLFVITAMIITVRTEKGEKMTEGEKLMCLMIRRFLDENPDKEIITYVHMVDGEYRHEVEIREKKVKTA